jgi:hypothetical protein
MKYKSLVPETLVIDRDTAAAVQEVETSPFDVRGYDWITY